MQRRLQAKGRAHDTERASCWCFLRCTTRTTLQRKAADRARRSWGRSNYALDAREAGSPFELYLPFRSPCKASHGFEDFPALDDGCVLA